MKMAENDCLIFSDKDQFLLIAFSFIAYIGHLLERWLSKLSGWTGFKLLKKT